MGEHGQGGPAVPGRPAPDLVLDEALDRASFWQHLGVETTRAICVRKPATSGIDNLEVTFDRQSRRHVVANISRFQYQTVILEGCCKITCIDPIRRSNAVIDSGRMKRAPTWEPRRGVLLDRHRNFAGGAATPLLIGSARHHSPPRVMGCRDRRRHRSVPMQCGKLQRRHRQRWADPCCPRFVLLHTSLLDLPHPHRDKFTMLDNSRSGEQVHLRGFCLLVC
jgi:hypothetical protein